MYTQDFIQRVKEVYPDSTEMIRLAEKGDAFLGRYLDDSSNDSITPNDVFTLPPDELRAKAERIQKKKDLYRDWCNGSAYTQKSLEARMCPILYMQNNNDPDKMKFEQIICGGIGAVGYFPACKKWNCKKECWTTYHSFKIANM